MVEPTDHHEVFASGEQPVDGGELPGEAEDAVHLVGVGDDVVPADGGVAGVGAYQGAEDPHDGGLAGSVGAEQGQQGAAGHGEVDTAEHFCGAERFADPVGGDGVGGCR